MRFGLNYTQATTSFADAEWRLVLLLNVDHRNSFHVTGTELYVEGYYHECKDEER